MYKRDGKQGMVGELIEATIMGDHVRLLRLLCMPFAEI
jgi:hypothetical protein